MYGTAANQAVFLVTFCVMVCCHIQVLNRIVNLYNNIVYYIIHFKSEFYQTTRPVTFCVKVGCLWQWYLTARMIIIVRCFTAGWIFNMRAIENLLSFKLLP